MAFSECLYSSRSEEWPTPQDFFGRLNAEFHFTLDPCATARNAKCKKYFAKKEDGLYLYIGLPSDIESAQSPDRNRCRRSPCC
jgi:hypothetical protein